jgi:hypothetical protein
MDKYCCVLPEIKYGPLKYLIRKSAWRQAREQKQQDSNVHDKNEKSTTILQTASNIYKHLRINSIVDNNIE